MSKLGRNEPCPCGSGLKFKKCCGGPVDQANPMGSPTPRRPDPQVASVLFGSGSAFVSSLLDGFARAAQPRRYRIMPLAESAQLNVTAWNQVYWQEILFRAHFGASAGLLRLHEWLQGARRAQEDGNVLMLAAGIRGFLEAAADTWQGFGDVAPTLADCHTVIRKAIEGELVDGALAPDLESSLINDPI